MPGAPRDRYHLFLRSSETRASPQPVAFGVRTGPVCQPREGCSTESQRACGRCGREPGATMTVAFGTCSVGFESESAPVHRSDGGNPVLAMVYGRPPVALALGRHPQSLGPMGSGLLQKAPYSNDSQTLAKFQAAVDAQDAGCAAGEHRVASRLVSTSGVPRGTLPKKGGLGCRAGNWPDM